MEEKINMALLPFLQKSSQNEIQINLFKRKKSSPVKAMKYC